MATTNLQKIGNSYGVIIGKKFLELAGIKDAKQVNIELVNGSIVIKPLDVRKIINRDVNTWGKQFREAIKKGQKPEGSVWNDGLSENADREWTW